jgi:hypothetical protein
MRYLVLWLMIMWGTTLACAAEPPPARVGEIESRAQFASNGVLSKMTFTFANRSRRVLTMGFPQGTPMEPVSRGSGVVFLGQAVEVSLKPGESRQVMVPGITLDNPTAGAFQPSLDRKLDGDFKSVREVMREAEAGRLSSGPVAARYVLISRHQGPAAAQAQLTRELGQEGAAQLRSQLAASRIATQSSSTKAPVTPSKIFSVGNIDRVFNGPTVPTSFITDRSYTLILLQTYHWNDGRGASGGTIGLRDGQGRLYGPWRVTTQGGSGARDVLWIAHPNQALPAGTYTVVDSSPATWSHNQASGGRGFVEVQGTP